MQKRVYQDPITGEIFGQCNIEDFYKNVERLLDIYWKDSDVEFHKSYPSAKNSTELTDQFIVAVVKSETPSKRDTDFGRGIAPRTTLPSKGMVLPKQMPTTKDGSKEDSKIPYYQPYDAIIRFEIYAKYSQDGVRLAKKFRNFLRETRAMHLIRGLNNLIFLEYSEVKDTSFMYRESYRQAYVEYFVQYQDTWTVRVPNLKLIQVSSTTGRDYIERDIEIPLGAVPHDHKFTVTGSYNELSKKVP